MARFLAGKWTSRRSSAKPAGRYWLRPATPSTGLVRPKEWTGAWHQVAPFGSVEIRPQYVANHDISKFVFAATAEPKHSSLTDASASSATPHQQQSGPRPPDGPSAGASPVLAVVITGPRRHFPRPMRTMTPSRTQKPSETESGKRAWGSAWGCMPVLCCLSASR
jgi:hypothetical protein